MASEENKERFNNILHELARQIQLNAQNINIEDISSTIELILQIHNSKNRIFVYGAGRSGFIGRSFAQRLMHLGIKSCFVSDAITYQYSSQDLLIIVSGSGETTSPVAIAKKAKEIGGKIILLSCNPKSTIGELSDYTIEIKGKSKDMALDQETLAPYTSLFDISVFAVLDSIGGILMKKLNVTEEDIDIRHASIE